MDSRILVLAIGNDIIGDDRASIAAAELLMKRYGEELIDFDFVYGGGMELLDFLEGRSRALVMDTITTGNNPPGTVFQLDPRNFTAQHTSSPHYIGLPEVIKLASMFEIEFPTEIVILAIEILPVNELSEDLSSEIRHALPRYVDIASGIIDKWLIPIY
jgi:hydrogenase maturation protease